MLDTSGKQVIGILLGIASMLFPVFFFIASLKINDPVGILFGFGMALIFAIAGIIFSSIGIKQAKDRGGSKAKGVIGLLLSIGGILVILRFAIVVGSAFIMALNTVSAESIMLI